MRSISEQVVLRLGTYVSPLNAAALWKRALEQSGVVGDPANAAERARLATALEHGLAFFVSDSVIRTKAIKEIRATLTEEQRPEFDRLMARSHGPGGPHSGGHGDGHGAPDHGGRGHGDGHGPGAHERDRGGHDR